MWKNLFVYPVLGRVFFIIGEILALCISFFFLFKLTLLTDAHLDFIFITIVLLMDIGEYIAKGVYFAKYGVPRELEGEKVIPELSNISEEDQNKKKTI